MEMPDVEEFVVEDSDEDKEDGEKKIRPVIKNAVDLQRLKVEKLMKNPEKPIIIPELPKDKDFMLSVPNFVRNVMGSSAGAGSGEFHVYRHLRRKEYARQKYIQARSIREQLDNDYREKLETNKKLAEEKTAKKRAKRLKRKQKMKQKGKKPKVEDTKSQEETHSSEESNEEDSQNEEESKSDNDNNMETNVEGPTVSDRPTTDKDKQESTDSQEATEVGCEQADSKGDDINVNTSNVDTEPAINSPKSNETVDKDKQEATEVGCEQADSKEDDTNVNNFNVDSEPTINSPKPNKKSELDEKDE